MKLAFIDTEFTGEHQPATLVSLGIVGAGGEELYLTFNDYDRDQVTPWLRQNVLNLIDEQTSVDRREGFLRVSKWIEDYSGGEAVSLVTAGKMLDLMLLFELWHFAHPELKYFHALHCLPACLNHAAHFDLPTVFFLAGVDPNSNRDALIGGSIVGNRHDALHDARVVRECYRRVVTPEKFPHAALPAQ